MEMNVLGSLYYAYLNRPFHNLDHITECFRALQSTPKTLIEDEDAVRMAIWFHDVFYDTTRDDNEVRSAEAAYQAAIEEGLPEEFARKVQRLVLVTTHSAAYPPVTNDEKLICDIDLVSLAADDFAGNTAKIRQEYAHVPDEAFTEGRRTVLMAFLERPFIYYTDHFRSLYEVKARTNLLEATST